MCRRYRGMTVPLGKLFLIVGSAGTIAAVMMTPAARSGAPAEPATKATRNVSAEEGRDALARARVWRKPPVPLGQARLGATFNAVRITAAGRRHLSSLLGQTGRPPSARRLRAVRRNRGRCRR